MDRRPLFLDRDGVINRDMEPYIQSADQIELLPGVGASLGRLCAAGFDLYVVSNQQGVAKGYIAATELPRMSERINALLSPHGAKVRHFEYCPALASDDDPCRKPSPGMILSVRDRFGLNIQGAFLVGDRWSDIEAAARAGLRPLLVTTGKTRRGDEAGWAHSPEAVFDDLAEAVDYIVAAS